MYYLYKKSKRVQLPEFHYRFKNFDELYDLLKYIRVSITGAYYINIISDKYEDVIQFIDSSDSYKDVFVYIEVNEALFNYIRLAKPSVSILGTMSNFDMFRELISKHAILFDKGIPEKVYFSIGHSYEEMDEALMLVKDTYPDSNKVVTLSDVEKLFVIDNIVYPRSVLIMYLRMERGRERNLNKCLEYFGNNLVLYSMRKNARNLLKEKIAYLKSGNGSYLIKTVPTENLVKILKALDYDRMGFTEIKTIMNMYEKGVSVYDFVFNETCADYDAEFDDVG